jgi:hypothetical protein
MNKSYDFRQTVASIRSKNLKLDINMADLEDQSDEPNTRSKIIYNSRQVRRMSNNYVKGGLP